MNKKYFFLDIDGTLTDKSTGKIVPSAQVALNELQKAGHFVAIATGRAHYKARKFMESVGLHDMVCCGGGGLVIHDELVQNIPLDLEKSKAIARQALSLGYGVLFALDDSIKVYTKDHTFQNQVGDRKEPTEYIYDENLDVDKLNVIYKMYISIPKEKEEELKTHFAVPFIENAKALDAYISVQSEAAVAVTSGVSAMHDVTEGGIFGALWEMAEASGVGLEIDLKKIPIRQETVEVCEFFGVNPYLLISSGCMLMAAQDGNHLVRELEKAGIKATIIGKATAGNDRVLLNEDERRFLEPPKTDELYKVIGR